MSKAMDQIFVQLSQKLSILAKTVAEQRDHNSGNPSVLAALVAVSDLAGIVDDLTEWFRMHLSFSEDEAHDRGPLITGSDAMRVQFENDHTVFVSIGESKPRFKALANCLFGFHVNTNEVIADLMRLNEALTIQRLMAAYSGIQEKTGVSDIRITYRGDFALYPKAPNPLPKEKT